MVLLFSAYLFIECEMSFKDQFESKCKKLEEALRTINSQKDEMEKMRCEHRKICDELVELKNVKKNFENKSVNIASEIGTYIFTFLYSCYFLCILHV